jgi:hypothetical protein
MDDEAEETSTTAPAAPQTKTTSNSSVRGKAISSLRQASPPTARSSPTPSPTTSTPSIDTGPSRDARSRSNYPVKRARLASSSTDGSAYASRSEYEHPAASYRPIAPAPPAHPSYSDLPPTSQGLYGAGNFYEAPSPSSSFAQDFVRTGRGGYSDAMLPPPRGWTPPLHAGLHGHLAHGGNTYASHHESFDWPVHQPRM